MSLALVREEALPASSSAFQAVAALRDDLASTASTSKGDALIGVKLPAVGAVARTQDDKNAEFVTFTDFDVVPNGSDATAGLQAALNAGYDLYLPPAATNYVTGPLTATKDGQSINGAGWSSCLELKSGSIGDMINSNGYSLTVRDLRLYGAHPYGKHNVLTAEPVAASANDQNALALDFDKNCLAENLVIHGFANKGIKPANASGALAHYAGTRITGCHVWQCWAGLDAGPDVAEYFTGSDNRFQYCQIGLRSSSGNQTFTGGASTDNYIGVQIYGTGIGNNAHGSVVGMLINHNTLYAIETVDVTNGFLFSGCNIFYGSIYLKLSTGIIIEGGIYDVDKLYFHGGGRNYIRNNFSPDSLANMVNTGYVTGSSDERLEGNFTPAGGSIWNSLPILGDWNFGGSVDQAAFQVGDAGAPDDNGFVWTSNGATGVQKLFGLNSGTRVATPTLTMGRTDGKITSLFLSLPNYANDAAAAAGGIPVGGAYRNGSALQVRVT